MTTSILKLSETPLLLISIAIALPVAAIGSAMDVSWVRIDIDNQIGQYLFYAIFTVVEFYLLLRGVWTREIIVDNSKEQLCIKAYCPFIYQPKCMEISDIEQVRVISSMSSRQPSSVYTLAFVKKNGDVITFGDFKSQDRDKYERWRNQIISFTGIKNRMHA